MPDYKKLYHKTFNAITDAERLLEHAAKILRATQMRGLRNAPIFIIKVFEDKFLGVAKELVLFRRIRFPPNAWLIQRSFINSLSTKTTASV